MSRRLLRHGGLYAPAPAGPVLSDTFTRADSTTTLGSADTGQAWTAATGTWGISSGRAYPVGSAGASQTALINAGINDVDATCVIRYSVGASLPGLVVRALDNANRLGAFLDFNGSQLQLFKSDAGTTTAINGAPSTFAADTDYTIRVLAVGTSVRCFVNGVEIITHTLAGGDATKYVDPTYTRVGIRGSTEAKWDDLSASAA